MNAITERLYNPVRKIILALAMLAGLAILAMIAVTAVDIGLRLFKGALRGAYDIVRVGAVIAISCSLPYVTAIKGHIAIEFFYHRFSPKGRLVLDSSFRIISLALFAVLCIRSALYGNMLLASAQVMPTLSIPVFWIPWLISLCFALIFLTVLYHLLHPGKELIKL